MDSIEIFVLIILILLNVGAIIWFSIVKSDYDDCQNSESIYCPSFVCGNDPSTTAPECKGATGNTAFVPYRVENGVVSCQNLTPAEYIYV